MASRDETGRVTESTVSASVVADKVKHAVDALTSGQRTAYILTAIEGWPAAKVADALKLSLGEIHDLVELSVKILSESDERFRLNRANFETRLRNLLIAELPESSHKTRQAIRLRAELMETRARQRKRVTSLLVVCVAISLSFVAVRSVGRKPTPTASVTTVKQDLKPLYDSVANQPMRLLPTGFSKSATGSVKPVRIATRPIEFGGTVGVWGSGLRHVTVRVTPKVREFPIGMFRQPTRPDSLDKAALQGPSKDFSEISGPNPFPVFLSWIAGDSVVEVTTPPGTTWNAVVGIARTLNINTDNRTFLVTQPPFGLTQVFLGAESIVQPTETWYYRISDNRSHGNLTIERLSPQGQAVRKAQYFSDPAIVGVRGKKGYAISQPSYSYSVRAEGEIGNVMLTSDRDVSVSVADGDWLLTTSGQNEQVSKLVQILNGLKQVDRGEWNELVASAELPAGETLASMRTPTRVVSVGEIGETKWNIAVAQLVTKAGCLSVRLDVGGTITGACVPIENRATAGPLAPILFHPKPQPSTKPQSVAVVFTDETVESILGPIGNVPVDRVVVKSSGLYSTFGVAVVALPDKFTQVTLQQLRRSPDGRLEQIQGPVITDSPDAK